MLHRRRNCRRGEQYVDQDVVELQQETDEGAAPLWRPRTVGAIALQPVFGFSAVERPRSLDRVSASTFGMGKLCHSGASFAGANRSEQGSFIVPLSQAEAVEDARGYSTERCNVDVESCQSVCLIRCSVAGLGNGKAMDKMSGWGGRLRERVPLT
jgi:hypothetical protein